jgi:hypothetical protein
MNATLKLYIDEEAIINMQINMTVREARELRATLNSVTHWPVGDFKFILDKAIQDIEVRVDSPIRI